MRLGTYWSSPPNNGAERMGASGNEDETLARLSCFGVIGLVLRCSRSSPGQSLEAIISWSSWKNS